MTEPQGSIAAQPCTQCAACNPTCPALLSPMQLHVAIRHRDWTSPALVALHACTECGDCEPVCPSHIPLLADFRYAKAEIAWQREVMARADAARQRFVARRQRLSDEANARSRALAANGVNPATSAAAAVDLLQAALARARKKHQATTAADGGD